MSVASTQLERWATILLRASDAVSQIEDEMDRLVLFQGTADAAQLSEWSRRLQHRVISRINELYAEVDEVSQVEAGAEPQR